MQLITNGHLPVAPPCPQAQLRVQGLPAGAADGSSPIPAILVIL